MSDGNEAAEGAAVGGKKQGGGAMRTVVTFGSIALVLGLLSYLSTLDHPPDLPGSAIHEFRFNTNGELVGLKIQAEAGAPTVEHLTNEKYDKKGIAKRVNAQCMTCHGAPVGPDKQLMDLTDHACQQIGKCVPAKGHPPKNSCIKCHRHPGN